MGISKLFIAQIRPTTSRFYHFFSWFLVAEALLACLAGSSLNFSAPHATTGPTAPDPTKLGRRGMSGSGNEFPKDQRQIQNLALPADQERFCLGGGYTFGRNRVSECNQHGRNNKNPQGSLFLREFGIHEASEVHGTPPFLVVNTVGDSGFFTWDSFNSLRLPSGGADSSCKRLSRCCSGGEAWRFRGVSFPGCQAVRWIDSPKKQAAVGVGGCMRPFFVWKQQVMVSFKKTSKRL